jgi:dipeptidyl aminopeptidase/acylaminoacyl peptidase
MIDWGLWSSASFARPSSPKETARADPDVAPELYRERDPETYVDRAKAAVLVIAGEQDPRCPLEGVSPWVDALRERGVEVELVLYPAGHYLNDTEENIRQVEMILAFFERNRG